MASIISDLIGAQVEFFDNLPPTQIASVIYNNQSYQWNTWAEGLTVNTAKSIVTFYDQFYKGQTAVTHKDYGKGSVTFLGFGLKLRHWFQRNKNNQRPTPP